MSNYYNLLPTKKWNEELSLNENLFPIDPAIKEIFKKDSQSLDNFVQRIKENEVRPTKTETKKNHGSKSKFKNDDDDVSTGIHSDEINQKSEPTEDHVTPLNLELIQILRSLFKQITRHSKECDIKEFLSKFNNLIRLPHVQLRESFEKLEISQIDDKLLEVLCNDIIQHEDIMYQNYVVFFKFTFLEKVRLITSKPSRDLLSILSKIAKSKGKPIVYGLLLPLIKESQEIARPQLEVITRIINGGLSEESIISLITELFPDFRTNESVSEIRPNHLEKWDDSMIEILFSIFNQKFQIENQNIFKRFIYRLDLNLEFQSNNQKLGQILLLLVTKHSESIMDHLEEVKAAAEKSTTFMKKSVLGKINSLSKKRKSQK
ncbi:fanconi anemia group E protein [Rhizophagus clarus]|uniref:Fanconi anemia group E protein n=1 Tax=Rhizophagus clarus TaxID=94130 RepID=A0A8H3L1P3_9GLOM|nr:fanconi anemia group E protein [Rhizophagus clarus]